MDIFCLDKPDHFRGELSHFQDDFHLSDFSATVSHGGRLRGGLHGNRTRSAHWKELIRCTMDDFSTRLDAIDRNCVKDFLSALRRPCYESQLLKLAFPQMEIFQASPLQLYQAHFLLFHLLYQLQEEFYQEGKYLFIHFMRTMLRPYPPSRRCRFFDERLGQFCGAPCSDTTDDYCSFHRERLPETALDALSLKYFYADISNFSCFDEDTAAAFMNGAWEILTHYETYQQAFRVLGLSDTAELAEIKTTFKHLAKQYHPDHGAASAEKFIEINNAYQFLLRVIPHNIPKNVS